MCNIFFVPTEIPCAVGLSASGLPQQYRHAQMGLKPIENVGCGNVSDNFAGLLSVSCAKIKYIYIHYIYIHMSICMCMVWYEYLPLPLSQSLPLSHLLSMASTNRLTKQAHPEQRFTSGTPTLGSIEVLILSHSENHHVQ